MMGVEGRRGAEMLVVGAGPTGLSLSSFMCLQGWKVRVIEAREEPLQESRAVALHARTLEMLDELGLAELLRTAGVEVHEINIYAGPSLLVRHRLEEVESHFPFIVDLGQVWIESLLEKHLEALGVKVERGVRLEALEAREDGRLAARMVGPEGERAETCYDYVFGCDGVGSRVRGYVCGRARAVAPERNYFVADLSVLGAGAERGWHISCGPQRSVFRFPMPGGLWRCVVELEPGDHPEPTKEMLLARLAWCGVGEMAIAEVINPRIYRLRPWFARKFRRGNAFILGDAAHVFPFNGNQGMNQGIQDAHNLAWRLGHVLRGETGPAFLDGFERERRFAALDMWRFTRRLERLATAGAVDPLRDLLLASFNALRHPARNFINHLESTGGRTRTPWRSVSTSLIDRAASIFAGTAQGSSPGEIIREAWVLEAEEKQAVRLRRICDSGQWGLLVFARGHLRADERAFLAEMAQWHPPVAWVQKRMIFGRRNPLETAPVAARLYHDAREVAHDRLGVKRLGLYLIRPDGVVVERALFGRLRPQVNFADWRTGFESLLVRVLVT